MLEERLHVFIDQSTWPALLAVLAAGVIVLGKGADWLVDQAVTLSIRSGMPRAIVGATVVSLGTTTPEAAVSVMAAVRGEPGLAMGNAVGSIICDTGLILGLCCLISPLPLERRVVNRQGWVQFGCGLLLVLACIPWSDPSSVFLKDSAAVLPQVAGWVFLLLLAVYMVWSARLARLSSSSDPEVDRHEDKAEGALLALVKLALAVGVVVLASHVLIAAATEFAERLQVPPSVIAATLVAFGTSLPELIICVTAVLKSQGELAVGNVIGADILNVLFVAGAAASVTPGGLVADPVLFRLQFPAMLFILLVFRIGIWQARDDRLKRPFGVVLLATYLGVTLLSYLLS